jgi:hypothetical protein
MIIGIFYRKRQGNIFKPYQVVRDDKEDSKSITPIYKGITRKPVA